MDKLDKDALPDLESAEVGEEIKRYLGYPSLDEMLDFINSRDEDDILQLTPEELSVNGIVRSEPMEDYLAKKAVSNSACKEALKTPLHYYYYVNQTLPKENKKAFELGTFAHLAFLEPKLFDQVIVEPKFSRGKLDGVKALIKFYHETLVSAKQKGDINTEDFAKAYVVSDAAKMDEQKECLEDLISLCPYEVISEDHKIIIDVLKRNYYTYGGGIIPKLLKGALVETSMYGCDPNTGLDVKIRPDGLQFAENIGVDAIISFKTTASDNIQKFVYDTAKYKYELGEGMYQETASDITGREFKTTIMIMLQTVAPYLPAVFFWDPDDIENGKYKFHNAMSIIKDCTEKGSFPGFDASAENGHSGIIKMKQPDWAMKELQPVDIDE